MIAGVASSAQFRVGGLRMRKTIVSAALAAAFVSCVLTSGPARASGDVVAVNDDYGSGTIVVKESERRLYLMLGGGRALRYPVGVGKAAMQWAGTAYIDAKYIRPAWSAPDSIRRDYSKLPRVIPGGSPQNPMGVAAMTLSGGGEYAIHGTNAPGTIGGFVSHGCIRMFNADITDLYRRVSVGTKVVVIR
jgi:lipoprotein-anchoring transpeptidase ErfK/SrfK